MQHVAGPPLNYGDTVKAKLKDGSVHLGTIDFVGQLPFGIWSFDVKVQAGPLAGETIKSHGISLHPNIVILTNDPEEAI